MLQQQTENKGRYTTLDEQRRTNGSQLIPRILAAFRDQHVAALSQLGLIESLFQLENGNGSQQSGVAAVAISELAIARLPRQIEAPSEPPTEQLESVRKKSPGRPPLPPTGGKPPIRMAIEIYAQQHGGAFTSPDLIKEFKQRGYIRESITTMLQNMTNTGVLRRVGHVGKGFAYRVNGAVAADTAEEVVASPKVAKPLLVKAASGHHSYWSLVAQFALQFGKPFSYADIRREMVGKLPQRMLQAIGTYLHNYMKAGQLKRGRNIAGATIYSLTANAAKAAVKAPPISETIQDTTPDTAAQPTRTGRAGLARIAAGGPKQVDSVVDWATKNHVGEFTPEQARVALKTLPKFRGYSRHEITARLNDFVKEGRLERPEKGLYRVAASGQEFEGDTRLAANA